MPCGMADDPAHSLRKWLRWAVEARQSVKPRRGRTEKFGELVLAKLIGAAYQDLTGREPVSYPSEYRAESTEFGALCIELFGDFGLSRASALYAARQARSKARRQKVGDGRDPKDVHK
jgi:hypothetical protein